jgi:hypothetical protein
MPDIPSLLEQTLQAEVAQTGMTLETEPESAPITTDSGLGGHRVAVTVKTANGQVQRRVYTMVRDERWLYGLHYIADEATYDHFLATYDAVASSIQPA